LHVDVEWKSFEEKDHISKRKESRYWKSDGENLDRRKKSMSPREVEEEKVVVPGKAKFRSRKKRGTGKG